MYLVERTSFLVLRTSKIRKTVSSECYTLQLKRLPENIQQKRPYSEQATGLKILRNDNGSAYRDCVVYETTKYWKIYLIH